METEGLMERFGGGEDREIAGLEKGIELAGKILKKILGKFSDSAFGVICRAILEV